MGKVKTVVIGDEIAEEEARKKAEVKREQKRAQKDAEKEATKHKEDTNISPTPEEVQEHPLVEEDKPKKKATKKAANDQYKFETGKKVIAAQGQVDKTKLYSLKDALELVKKTSFSKFDGSVELTLNVAEKGIRGTVSLPNGTGKQVRVKVATDALIEDISKNGKIDFDILVAEPSMMPKLAKVAKILGPKGLMPNPKTGTIGPDPEKLVKDLSNGQVQWKTQNDLPIIHTTIGKVSFDEKKLEENYLALTKSIGKDKIKSAYLKATMGPSVKLAI